MILIRAFFASAASSRNLSRRSVASSTVMPITLISSEVLASPRCEVTVTLGNLAAGEPDFGAGAAPSTPVISSSATFIRSGPASISADDPSIRRNNTGLLNPRIQIFARFAADVLHFSARRFLDLRAQLSLFYRFDDARNILVKALLHFRELRFEFLDALLLPFDPLCPQLLAFFFQRMPLAGHLPLHAIQLVAAAMQIGDQVRGFARFRRQQ